MQPRRGSLGDPWGLPRCPLLGCQCSLHQHRTLKERGKLEANSNGMHTKYSITSNKYQKELDISDGMKLDLWLIKQFPVKKKKLMSFKEEKKFLV